MIHHLVTEWPRYVALAEIGALISCFIALHFGSRSVLPRTTYLAGWGMLYVFAAVAVAIVVNVMSPVAPTPGVRALCFALAPVALGGIFAVLLAVRDNRDR